jgi:predicted PurR-regulated permease PerM
MNASSQPSPPSGPQRVAGVLFVAVIIALCLWLLWRFIPALVWALVIAVATWPLRERCVRAGLGPTASAALLTAVLGILVVLPVLIFGAEIAREAASITQVVDQARHGQLEPPDWLSTLPLVGPYAVEWWHAHLGAPDMSKQLLDASRSAHAVQFGRDAGRWIIRRLVTLGFTLLALFFLYKNGPRIAADAERLGIWLFGAPAKRYGRFSLTAVRASVNGLVFVGLAEGVILGVAYGFCGVPHPILFSVATAVLGVVPFGAPAVLALASLTLIVGSRLTTGLVLLGAGLVAIFIADHTARPALIGGSIRLPFFWALLGVFGGLEAFGIVGLFVGPAILAVALAIWRETVYEESSVLSEQTS